ncbi:MAG: hypothetical protein ABL967_12775 [Bryobacteraceae bacterium]
MTNLPKPGPLASRAYRRAGYLLAAACFVMLAVIFGHPYFTNASRPARGISDPITALQMARDVREVDAVFADVPSPDREIMRLKQYADFAFIVAYALLALTLGEILSKRTRLGRVLAVAAVLAAVFDAREDVLILKIAATPLELTSQAMIDALRLASIVKWAFTAITVAILGYCWMKIPRWFTRVIGGMELAGAGLAIAGIAVNTLLPWSAPLMAFGILLNAATLKFLTHEPATADPVSRPV